MTQAENNPAHPGFESQVRAITALQQRLSDAVSSRRPAALVDLLRAEFFCMSMELSRASCSDSPLAVLYHQINGLLPSAWAAPGGAETVESSLNRICSTDDATSSQARTTTKDPYVDHLDQVYAGLAAALLNDVPPSVYDLNEATRFCNQFRREFGPGRGHPLAFACLQIELVLPLASRLYAQHHAARKEDRAA